MAVACMGEFAVFAVPVPKLSGERNAFDTTCWRAASERDCVDPNAPRQSRKNTMKTNKKTKTKTTKTKREFFIADALLHFPEHTGREAWGRELLRARTPRELVRKLDGRPHVAYASNGTQAIRIAIIDTGSTIFAPIWPKAEAEPLKAVLGRINADPNGWSA